jgi:hypothetical protein
VAIEFDSQSGVTSGLDLSDRMSVAMSPEGVVIGPWINRRSFIVS